MNKNETFTFIINGEYYRANLVPLKRKSIYGERKVIALDKNDNECIRVFYDEDDMSLYPKKATGLCKLNKDGTIYSAPAKQSTDKKQQSDDTRVELELLQDSWAKYYLSYEVKDVYTLEGLDTSVLATLIGEKIFNQKKFGAPHSWMFQRNGTVFFVCAKPSSNFGDYAEKNLGYQVDDQPLVSDVTELDDIDFEMF